MILKRAQERMPKSRYPVDGCKRLIFAIAERRLDQIRLDHGAQFAISMSPADLEKTVRLLVGRDQEFVYVS